MFPMMCNGFVKVDYSNNIPDLEGDGLTTTDIPYGIWGHVGSFCFDAVITPYETNGSASDILTSQKTTPIGGSFSSVNYMGAGHKMCIFQNTNLKVFLLNSSYTSNSSVFSSTLNYNNPSTYKIQVELTTGSTTTTLISDTMIFPNTAQPIQYGEVDGIFNTKGRLTHTKIETLGGSAHGGSTTFTSGTSPASNLYTLGELLFTKNNFNGVNIGRITNLSGTTVTLSGTPSSLNSQTIYREALKEANYVNDICHIGISYNNPTQKLNILYNGKIIKSTTHTDSTNFQLAAEDIFLGANGTSTYVKADSDATAINNTSSNNQFYGVFHEMSYSKGTISSFDSGLLNPIMTDNLLFLLFEEVDM